MTAAPYQFEQFFSVYRTQPLGALSPDGTQVLFVSDISGQWNLWQVPVTGGWPRQLTLFTDHAVRSVRCAPNGDIYFTADAVGTEQWQVYRLAPGGWPERLTSRDDCQYTVGDIGKSGRYLLYTGNEQVPQLQDVLLRDLTTGETRRLAHGPGYAGESLSPDERFALISRSTANTNDDLFLLDLQAGGELRLLTAHAGEANFAPVGWAPDGSGFYLNTNQGREHHALAFYHLDGGELTWLTDGEWDVEAAVLSKDGRQLAWSSNEDGYGRLHRRDLQTGADLPVPTLPGVALPVRFAADGSALLVYHNSARRAGDLFWLQLDGGELRRLTHSMVGNVPEAAMVEPELIHVTTWDGLQVPAFLYKPQGLQPGQKLPVVLAIHGGPEGQERPIYAYTGFYQYLLSRGIAVLAPNIRGSSGYGLRYQQLIHRDWGGGELQDIEVLAQWLQAQSWVDADRLGVWGGSFGGFATLSAVTRLPAYWAVGVDFCGPSNLVSFLNTVPPTWKPVMRDWLGDTETEADFLMERSPITYATNVRCPLLVVQGANDPRVVKAESDQMVERMRARGATVEYLVFDDEGHGFTKRTNQLKGYKAMADYLVSHLAPQITLI